MRLRSECRSINKIAMVQFTYNKLLWDIVIHYLRIKCSENESTNNKHSSPSSLHCLIKWREYDTWQLFMNATFWRTNLLLLLCGVRVVNIYTCIYVKCMCYMESLNWGYVVSYYALPPIQSVCLCVWNDWYSTMYAHRCGNGILGRRANGHVQQAQPTHGHGHEWKIWGCETLKTWKCYSIKKQKNHQQFIEHYRLFLLLFCLFSSSSSSSLLICNFYFFFVTSSPPSTSPFVSVSAFLFSFHQ